jgi:hypothetical protein
MGRVGKTFSFFAAVAEGDELDSFVAEVHLAREWVTDPQEHLENCRTVKSKNCRKEYLLLLLPVQCFVCRKL